MQTKDLPVFTKPQKDIGFSIEQLEVLTALPARLFGAFLTFTQEQINAIGWAYKQSKQNKDAKDA